MEILGLPAMVSNQNAEYLENVYQREFLTIDNDSVSISIGLYDDDRCISQNIYVESFSEIFALSDPGGEIQDKNEWISKDGWPFTRYIIPAGLGEVTLIFGLHNVDDRLYVARPIDKSPLDATAEDYVVDFNRYYTRSQY